MAKDQYKLNYDALDDNPQEDPKKRKNSPLEEVFDWCDSLIFAAFYVLLIFTFLIRTAVVDGTSMVPTLTDGDKLLVSRMFYTLDQGDIVVVDSSSYGKIIVKRVIATEGQQVDIDFQNGIVYVDGKELIEPYANGLTTLDEGAFTYPVTVPEGHIFVMGDNRGVSKDSRSPDIGFVPMSDVVGEVFWGLYPFGQIQ